MKSSNIIVVLLILLFNSCSKEEESSLLARFQITPTIKNYNTIELGKEKEQKFIISNSGTAQLKLINFTMEGDYKGEFKTNYLSSTIVKQGETYEFTITFIPKSIGVKTITLKIKTNIGDYTVKIKGEAIPKPVPKFLINKNNESFGKIDIGKTSVKEFIITNRGNADLKLINFSFKGDNSGEFSTNAVNNTMVSMNKSYVFKVSYSPNKVGSKKIEMNINTNIGLYKISLNGISVYKQDDNSVKIDYVDVIAGTFQMGNIVGKGFSNERPQHKVTLTKNFKIGKYEVTNFQYAIFMNSIGLDKNGIVKDKRYINIRSIDCQVIYKNGKFISKEGMESHPVGAVTWIGAKAFADWVGGRLPTEAEWEYSAQGGNKSKGYTYSGSNVVEDVAWVWNSFNHLNNQRLTRPVGSHKPNELGIYDMSGNVSEWCSDWFGDYTSDDKTNPSGPINGVIRVLRGGDWGGGDYQCRVKHRRGYYPSEAQQEYRPIGFRVAK